MQREPVLGNDAQSAILPRLHLEGGGAAVARDPADIERMAGTRNDNTTAAAKQDGNATKMKPG
ncbi:hypothetical protein [Paraburkholderia sartisoli]|uniref:hypothetical protein n=1 Tax=Paraburkholderia sartisoli TaxID=83784 RepID=UPI000B847F94|nr:hypothetical protein [Paraburkholderia sartisoli]